MLMLYNLLPFYVNILFTVLIKVSSISVALILNFISVICQKLSYKLFKILYIYLKLKS